jgi:predicted XRE-type DNA-binding protein
LIEYGVAPEETKRFMRILQAEIEAVGQRNIARESGVSRRTLSHLMEGKSMRERNLKKLITQLTREAQRIRLSNAQKWLKTYRTTSAAP